MSSELPSPAAAVTRSNTTPTECSRGKESVHGVYPQPAASCAVIVVTICRSLCAGDLPGGTSFQPFVRPKKSSSTQDRAFEYVQKAADFSLNDGTAKIIPHGVGYICLLERAQTDQVLVAIRSQGLRGWAPANALVPLNHADVFFSQQILANPHDPFAFLMRGMVRYENDDLAQAFGDVDEAIRLNPKYVPALVERAYLWQCRNRLDLALADVNQAIGLDPLNSYAYVERGVFQFGMKEYGNALRDFDHALRLGSRAAVVHLCKGMIHMERGEGEPAIAEFNTAIRIDPERLDAYIGLATVDLLRSDSKKALEVFDHAVLVDLSQSRRPRGASGLLYLSRQERPGTGRFERGRSSRSGVRKSAARSRSRLVRQTGFWSGPLGPGRRDPARAERRRGATRPGLGPGDLPGP